METSLKLASVTDGYIDFLIRNGQSHVYSNKEGRRSHDRLYIGALLQLNQFEYYIPLKEKGYIISENGDKKIRPDSFLIMRMIDQSLQTQELLGTIRFGNMIPVPPSCILPYDANQESDLSYKSLVRKELIFIRKNEDKIIARAHTIYNNKIYGNRGNIYTHCLDFKALENLHALWISSMQS